MIQKQIPISDELSALEVSSEAFRDRENIPSKYTCDGENINPPLTVQNIPQRAKSLVLIVDDPDAGGGTFMHWMVWNIPPAHKIKENAVPGTEGKNDSGHQAYSGPCPPSGTHRYLFKVYALDELIELRPGASKKELEKTMAPHVIGFGELTGMFKRAS